MADGRRLGVVFSAGDGFHADLLDGIQLAAEGVGCDLALGAMTPGRDGRRALDALLADGCEALLLLGPRTSTRHLAELGHRLPVVAVAGDAPGVRGDDADGVRQVVEHLVALGHRDVVHVDGGRAPGAAERRTAFRATMRSLGLADRAGVVPGGPTEQSGAAAAAMLLDGRPRPSAVAAFDDRCALGLLDALTRAGVAVGEDVSLVGYGDEPFAGLGYVDLTTVAEDVPRMARLAVEAALAWLDGGADPGPDVLVEPRLVVRGTTAPRARRAAGA